MRVAVKCSTSRMSPETKTGRNKGGSFCADALHQSTLVVSCSSPIPLRALKTSMAAKQGIPIPEPRSTKSAPCNCMLARTECSPFGCIALFDPSRINPPTFVVMFLYSNLEQAKRLAEVWHCHAESSSTARDARCNCVNDMPSANMSHRKPCHTRCHAPVGRSRRGCGQRRSASACADA